MGSKQGHSVQTKPDHAYYDKKNSACVGKQEWASVVSGVGRTIVPIRMFPEFSSTTTASSTTVTTATAANGHDNNHGRSNTTTDTINTPCKRQGSRRSSDTFCSFQ
ncbi:unnamed protein product [Ectocarpus sp. 4 AP-2014]